MQSNKNIDNKEETKWSWTTFIEIVIMQILIIGTTLLFTAKLPEVAWVSLVSTLTIICFSISEISRQIRYYVITAAVSIITGLIVIHSIKFKVEPSNSVNLRDLVKVGYTATIVFTLTAQVIIAKALNIRDKLREKKKTRSESRSRKGVI